MHSMRGETQGDSDRGDKTTQAGRRMREEEERGSRYIEDSIHLGKCGQNAVGR